MWQMVKNTTKDTSSGGYTDETHAERIGFPS
jgi:hypothetical protein